MSSRMSRRDFAKTAARASLGTLAAGYSTSEALVARPGQSPESQSSPTRMCRPAVLVPPTKDWWENWPLSEPKGPPSKHTPSSVVGLVAIARNASAQDRVRASGSRWSASGAARADHAWVETSALTGIISWDLTALADQFPQVRRPNLVLVRAGTKIHSLATELWARQMSIPTLGGSMGQSIAGAISTGTHGSDIELPPIAAMVRAIHLVAPGGCEYWLEHPDWPIASESSLRRNYADWHESMTWLRNADAFNAALVSVGRCGFIYSYVLEVEPAYQLRADRGRSSWTAVRAHLQRAADSDNWLSFIRNNPLPFNESTTVESSGSPGAISTGAKLSVMWTGTKNPGQFRWTHHDPETGGWTRKRIVDDGRVRHSPHPPAVAFFNGRYYLAWTGTGKDDGNPYIHLMRSDATGEFWSDHIRFDGTLGRPEAQSREGPVLLAANGKLHIVWVGSNSPGQFRWITSTNGSTWGDRRILTDPAESRESNHRPAIAFFNGRYYLTWTGTNPAHPHVHVIRSNDSSGRSWGSHIVFDGAPTHPEAMSSDGPCLLAANNKLHIAWVGSNQPGEFRWITSIDGVVWGDKRTLNDGQSRQSKYTPDLVFHDGHYFLFWTGYGSDPNIHVLRSSSATGTTWDSHAILSVPPGPRLNMRDIRSLDVALSPESANGHAWWTARTKVPMNQRPTPVQPDRLSASDRTHLLRALAVALDPSKGPTDVDILAFLVGGVAGGALFGIGAAIARREIADREDVFAAIADLVFDMELNKPPATGPSFEITSGKGGYTGSYEEYYREFWLHSPKVQFTEVFFNAQSSDYLRFIDEIRTDFQSASSGKQAGYIAIRFMAPSEAPLAMQRWPVTVAVEVVILRDLDARAKQTIEAVNRRARNYDARFHWGMIRPADYRPIGVRNEIERWKAGAVSLGVRAGDGFSSDFSRASGLEP
jgi:FAD binding domain